MQGPKYNRRDKNQKKDITAISNVYYTDMGATLMEDLPQELERLVKRAGMMDTDFNDKYITIRIHFGRPGSLAYLRIDYSKVLADLIRSQDGKVFLIGCNTPYAGRRKNTLDHLDTAYENGYSPFTTGCYIMITDGLKGADEALAPIDGEYVKGVKIGQAIMDADTIISLTYLKGYETTGFGGALRSLGIGSGSRVGKMEMYSAGKSFIHTDKYVGYGTCRRNCAHDATTVPERKASIDISKYVGCGRCIGTCLVGTVDSMCDEANDILNRKITGYTLAVLRDRPNFHVSLVVDVFPNCDCHSENDAPITPNVGTFVSLDPAVLDMACVDVVNRQPVFVGNSLSKQEYHSYDYFINIYPGTSWEICINHAVKLSLDNKEYNLVTIQSLAIRRTRET